MKKKVLITVFLLYGSSLQAMNWLDFCATWLAASYAYHGWIYWTDAQHGKPSSEVIKELKRCLRVLKEKVRKEQRDIEECQKTLSRIQQELHYYKSALGLRV